MTTVEIPSEVAQRLQTEADRRGVTLGQLLTEIAAGLPGTPATKRRKLAFAGATASGGAKPAREADRWLDEGFGH